MDVLLNRIALALSLLAMLPSLMLGIGVPSQAAVFCPSRNCLGAHDIDGVQLDMTVAEVARLFNGRLQSIGSGQFKAERDGTSYDFGFTLLGHLFRIDSSQELGRFEPDIGIGLALTQKLVRKYGHPDTNQLPGGPAFWQFIEYYDAGGFRAAQETESLSAMFTTRYQAPTTLDLKLMDFRILRRDMAVQNSGPSQTAQARMHF